MKRFVGELQRRRVFRTAALYIVGAWLCLQVADVSFPGFGIPDAAMGVLIWTAVLGPVALVWMQESVREDPRASYPLRSTG